MGKIHPAVSRAVHSTLVSEVRHLTQTHTPKVASTVCCGGSLPVWYANTDGVLGVGQFTPALSTINHVERITTLQSV